MLRSQLTLYKTIRKECRVARLPDSSAAGSASSTERGRFRRHRRDGSRKPSNTKMLHKQRSSYKPSCCFLIKCQSITPWSFSDIDSCARRLLNQCLEYQHGSGAQLRNIVESVRHFEVVGPACPKPLIRRIMDKPKRASLKSQPQGEQVGNIFAGRSLEKGNNGTIPSKEEKPIE
jgi:hypothetical protein